MTDPRAPSEREKFARSLWRREEPVSSDLPMQSFRPQPSLARRDDDSTYQPPPYVAPPEPGPPSPPPSVEALRAHLGELIADHQDAVAQLDRLTQARDRAQQALYAAYGEVESAEAMVKEARAKEPHDYVERLLANNGDATAAVDLVAVAEEKLGEANRNADTQRRGRDALDEAVTRAESSVRWAAQRRAEAIASVITSSPEYGALLADFHAALQRVGALRAAISAAASPYIQPAVYNLTSAVEPNEDDDLPRAWVAARKALAIDPGAELPAE